MFSGPTIVAALGVVSTLVGVILAQLIAARSTLANKKLELFYARRADAYRVLIEKAWEFAVDPRTLAKYLSFQSASQSALIVASNDVAEALKPLGMAGLSLRFAESEKEIVHTQTHDWYMAMETMRRPCALILFS